jgi:hypothetical protein
MQFYVSHPAIYQLYLKLRFMIIFWTFVACECNVILYSYIYVSMKYEIAKQNHGYNLKYV